MATYTDNYQLTLPGYADVADVADLNHNTTMIDEIMHGSQVSLAPGYDSTQTYNTGDVVMYGYKMYKCTADGVTGAWDPTEWEPTTASEVGGGSGNLYGEASGNPATFPDGSDNPLEACNVDINPVQDLHGYDKPWAPGAGKNILPTSLATMQSINTTGTWDGNKYTILGVTYTVLTDEAGNIIGINANGLSSGNADLSIVSSFTAPEACVMTGCPADGGNNKYQFYLSGNVGDYGSGANISSGATGRPYLRIFNGYNADNLVFYPMIRKSTESAGFEPYSNICPITPRTEVNITVSATQGGAGTDTQINLGRNVYGGTLNVKTGELTVNRWFKTFTWSQCNRTDLTNFTRGTIELGFSNVYPPTADVPQICNLAEYKAAFSEDSSHFYCNAAQALVFLPKGTDTSTTIEVSGELPTPLTYTLTGEEVRSILGQNYIEADSGDITVAYVRDLNSCINDILRRLAALEA